MAGTLAPAEFFHTTSIRRRVIICDWTRFNRSSSRKEYPMPKTKKPFLDFRAVRARITMEQVLAHYNALDTFKRTGSRLSGPCPIHGGSNPTQFRVDTEKNLWNC